jgi:hypothetical protein
MYVAEYNDECRRCVDFSLTELMKAKEWLSFNTLQEICDPRRLRALLLSQLIRWWFNQNLTLRSGDTDDRRPHSTSGSRQHPAKKLMGES